MVIFGALGRSQSSQAVAGDLPAAATSISSTTSSQVLGVGRDATQTDDTFRAQMGKALGRIGRGRAVRRGRLAGALHSGSTSCRRPHRRRRLRGDRQAARPSSSGTRRAERVQPAVLSRRAAERVRADRAAISRRADSRRGRARPRSGRGRASSSRNRSAAASRRALTLNDLVLGLFAEHQTYRIDHYLGKETVQNVLVLRFANSIFEPIWNRQWIDHVQITAAETVGVEERGKYYEEAGVVRDMFQNHLLQLLVAHGDGAAGADDGQRGARREGEGAEVDAHGSTPETISAQRGARAVHRGDDRREAGAGLHAGAGRRAGLARADVRRGAASTSTTGDGMACRSICGRASGWRSACRRSRFSSGRRRISCSAQTSAA